MNDFEQQIKKLSVVEPSRRYTARARSLIRAARPKKPLGLTWALAACLVLSLCANLYLIGADRGRPSGSEALDSVGITKQIHDVYVPGTQNSPYLKVKENS